MVFVLELGFGEVRKRAKIVKIKGYGAYFTRLEDVVVIVREGCA